MNTKLKQDILEVLLYFEAGLADVEEGSGEEQPKLKEIRSILRRMKANGADTGQDKCHIQNVSNTEGKYCECAEKEPEIKAMWIVCAKCGKPIKDE